MTTAEHVTSLEARVTEMQTALTNFDANMKVKLDELRTSDAAQAESFGKLQGAFYEHLDADDAVVPRSDVSVRALSKIVQRAGAKMHFSCGSTSFAAVDCALVVCCATVATVA